MVNKPSPSRINDLPIGKQGYIKLTLIFLVLIFVFFLYPHRFPQKAGNGECVLGEPPRSDAPVLTLPVAENFGPSVSKKSQFRMVRSNVTTGDALGLFKPPDPGLQPNEDDAHLVQVDHNPETPEFDENPQYPGYDEFYPYGGANGKIYPEWEMAYVGIGYSVVDLGLVFFRNKDPKKIREIPSNDLKVTDHIYSVDIYQDIEKTNEVTSSQVTALLKCEGKGGRPTNAYKSSLSVVVPEQNKSPEKDQLQLEWFLFESTGIWGVHCKPAVYLYPKEKSLVNVRVYPKGELSYTDPPYDPESGWTVFANSLGTLSTIRSEEHT